MTLRAQSDIALPFMRRLSWSENRALAGLYKGLASTTMKQCATSAVRMGSYNMLKQKASAYGLPQNDPHHLWTPALLPVPSPSMPASRFDTVKSRAQSAKRGDHG